MYVFNTLSFYFLTINIIPLPNYAYFLGITGKVDFYQRVKSPRIRIHFLLILLYLREKYSHLQVSGGQSRIFFSFFFLSAPEISPGLFPSGEDVDFFFLSLRSADSSTFWPVDFRNKVNFLYVHDIIFLYRKCQR